MGIAALDNQDLNGTPQESTIRRVGKYRILSELGRGGTASVYLAVARGHGGVNKLVVLKALLPEAATDPDALTRFLDEARIAAQLNHANIVQTYEVGTEGDRNVIVMEYLEGQTLSQLMRRAGLRGEPFPLAMQIRIIINVLEGLHYAHEFTAYDGAPMNLVHRDVSPQNVFVTYDGQVKVLDFGIAKIASMSTHTTAGLVRGKIAYMAPEQMRAEAVDRRADIFSVGAMLWAIAAGRKLWKDVAEVQVIRAVLTGDIPSPRSANPECDEELARIVLRALAPHPAERYASALELQADLERYSERLGHVVTQKEVGAYSTRLFSSTRFELKAHIERELARITAEEPVSISNDFSIAKEIQGSTLTPRAVTAESLSVGQRMSGKRSLLGVAIIGLLLAAGGLWLRATQLGRPAAAEVAPIAGLPANPSPTGPAATTTTAPPEDRGVKTVKIGFRLNPPDAAVFVDGRSLPSGTTSELFNSDDKVHVLRVEAPGLEPFVRELLLTHDDTVEVNLSKYPGKKGAFHSAGKAAAPAVAPPAAVPAAKPAAPAAGTPSAKPDCDEPFFLDAKGIKRVRPECL